MNKKYLLLAKPGIIFGNLITMAAGFFFASKGSFNGELFTLTLLGLSCVIGSACVFNNLIDRKGDEKMERTRGRPLVSGAILPSQAIGYGITLALTGFAFLSYGTNLLSVAIAFLGFFFYVILYSYSKYKTHFATLIGSIAGAIPPVVGYCAVANRIDSGVTLLFLVVLFWQMPHFYAIAVYRLKEYKAASIPVLPLIKGIQQTKIQMLFYIFAMTIPLFLLPYFGYTGSLYLASSILLTIGWLLLSFSGFRSKDDTLWARQMFRFSLVVIMVLSVTLMTDFTL